MNEHSLEIRVSYADTDQMGVVYYGNYFTWFERGRTELLRAAGLNYKDMEKRNIFLPVVEAACSYKASAYYDDLILIRTKVGKIGRSSICFTYEILRKEDRQLLATGETRHAFINNKKEVIPVPEEIKTVLLK